MSRESDQDVHTVCVVTSKPPLPHMEHGPLISEGKLDKFDSCFVNVNCDTVHLG